MRRRVLLAQILLLTLVARAVLPSGFMPDVEAAAKGVFKVVICTSVGAKMMALDASGNPVDDQGSIHHDQPCAFAGLAAIALPVMDAPAFVQPVSSTDAIIPPLAVTLPPTRAGPPLGSRGPPTLS